MRQKTRAPGSQYRDFGFSREGLTVSQYRQEGDTSLYSDDALAARRNLRHHPDIVTWLERWFNTYMSARRDGSIVRSEYISVQVWRAMAHIDASVQSRLAPSLARSKCARHCSMKASLIMTRSRKRPRPTGRARCTQARAASARGPTLRLD